MERVNTISFLTGKYSASFQWAVRLTCWALVIFCPFPRNAWTSRTLTFITFTLWLDAWSYLAKARVETPSELPHAGSGFSTNFGLRTLAGFMTVISVSATGITLAKLTSNWGMGFTGIFLHAGVFHIWLMLLAADGREVLALLENLVAQRKIGELSEEEFLVEFARAGKVAKELYGPSFGGAVVREEQAKLHAV